MHLFFQIGSFKLPGYGLSIAVGAILANLVVLLFRKKLNIMIWDYVILEAYGLLGGFVGAKLLYLLVSWKDIEWNRFFEPQYFNQLMMGGYVFYGGLILALIVVLVMGKVHKINAFSILKKVIFAIPLAHAFGRVGCYMAGCCYGMPYEGPLAVVFPELSLAPHGVKLFPVQIVEAGLLFVIFAVLLILILAAKWDYAVETYLFLYGIVRLIMEGYRADAERGGFGGLYTSQWISIFMIAGSSIWFLVRVALKKRKSSL